jgi:uncharacterized membrane protein (UPF0136 family)
MASGNRTLRDGLVMGLIASVAVAAFYAVFDILAARGRLYTVDLLGKTLFRHLRDPSVLLLPVHPDMRVVLLYNAVHLAISLAIGLTVAGLVGYAEQHRQHARWITGVIIGGFFVTIVVVGMLTAPFRAMLPWWSIVLANALAVLLAGWYLVRCRPGMFGRLLLPIRSA